MPEVQNIGAADYAQYQNQYPEQYSVPEDLQAQEIYDPAVEEKKAASGRRLGAAILGALIGATITGIATHHLSTKSANAAKDAALAELEALKSSEAVRNYDGLKKAAEEINKEAENSWFFVGKKNVKDKLGRFFSKGEAKAAEQGAEEATETAAKAAEDSAENAASAVAKHPTHF